MKDKKNEYVDSDMQQFTNKLGLVLENVLENFEVTFFKGLTFLPDMAMHFGSFAVKEDFTRVTGQSDLVDGIGIIFHNIFEHYGNKEPENRKARHTMEAPYVRIFPYTISQTLQFKKNTQVSHVSISISAQYLKDFLKEEAEHFAYLFDRANSFWIEELMTDDILRTVNEIAKKQEPGHLKSFYYKVKAMELLFYLFESLKKRESAENLKLNAKEIQAVYNVRDRIVSSLSNFNTIAELKQIAGMNEFKLRKIFKQVFGMGVYDYYQHLRMKEAARLLREEKLSVSEAGYEMGFENLGHFTRVFEKHIGKKPKKYVQNLQKTNIKTTP
ncbi:AraC family transcriptional regulator [uncultured Pedobacter sp.]|uniref:helix-turn-helix domain-containing protein n=1 Tax=uncultured Pedobacter sp. TaxID=246139 RepID=UPI0025D9E93A|nr:AraC family transcriptional regulator [uncultured Pedobacter sp.]